MRIQIAHEIAVHWILKHRVRYKHRVRVVNEIVRELLK